MSRKLTGYGVLAWLAAFFGLILVTNIVFISLAIRTFRGEDEQRPYLQGVQYNQTLARRVEQTRRGWQASIAATRLPSGAVRAIVTLTGTDRSPQSGAVLTGLLRHPADENLDHSLRFREVEPGRYAAETADVQAGNWDIAVFNQGKAPFHASRRLWVP